MQQAYLVAVSALLAWSATKTPEWTTWGLLLAVSIWDIIAVLMPRGPLKELVEEGFTLKELKAVFSIGELRRSNIMVKDLLISVPVTDFLVLLVSVVGRDFLAEGRAF